MISGDELIPRLEELYRKMDQAYAAIATEVGFSCKDCDGERCCTVDLTLHTAVEKQYLRKGFKNLDTSRQREILARCDSVLVAKDEDPLGDAYRDAVCVLNFDGLCILYPYRPMLLPSRGHTSFHSQTGWQDPREGGMFPLSDTYSTSSSRPENG